MANGRFLSEFIARPRQIGAIAPSSSRLAREMVRWFDWENIRTIVEYGPGTGAFTGAIRAAMAPGTRFVTIELSASLASILRERFPDVRVHQDSVQNVRAICEQEGIEEVDAIVCGLPWAAFAEQQQRALLDATQAVLSPRAQFATFAYLQGMLLPAGMAFRRELRQRFGDVQTSPVVWLNLPPALIYRCRGARR